MIDFLIHIIICYFKFIYNFLKNKENKNNKNYKIKKILFVKENFLHKI